jgi:acyl dehydratase
MTIDRDRLLAHNIPEVVQEYGPEVLARYALSIGMGQDPMDRVALPYATGAQAMPAVVCVLGHPGFWLGDPATGVDALRLVHGEQGITIHAPFPATGRIRAKTRPTGLVDKGEGRGALLYSEKEIRDADDDTLLATCRITTFLRGDGGYGGASDEPKSVHTLPDGPPDHVIETPTRSEQALLYRWNGDPNTLHTDPDVAAKAGFEQPILHGLCTFGVAAQALLSVLCDGDATRFGSMDARFTAHVFPGEMLVTDIWKDGSFRTRVPGRDKVAIGNGIFWHAGGTA